jgi:uncharacterized protein YjiS (DUF1127 family)
MSKTMQTERYLNTIIWRNPGSGLKETLILWHRRARQRRQLQRLDDHMLRDIGIDRIAAWRESEKPFWKA